jgi:hypothetical protein
LLYVFLTSYLCGGTKKALHLIWESPLTRCGSVGIIEALERAARPSGCSKPGTLTRQSLVPGYFYFSPKNFRFLNQFFPGFLTLPVLPGIHLVRNKNVFQFRSC